MMLVFAEVHPFSSVTAEPIAVDIVAPDQVKPEAACRPRNAAFRRSRSAPTIRGSRFDAVGRPAAGGAAAFAGRDAASRSRLHAQPQQPAALAPDPAAATTAGRAAAVASRLAPPPAYIPAQPDLSVKYHVLLGLPQDRPADGFDAPATQKADLGSEPVAEFRRHLRTCSTLPESIAASDKIAIKLRVLMSRDGTLAADPDADRGQRLRKGAAPDAKRDHRAQGLSALRDVAGG